MKRQGTFPFTAIIGQEEMKKALVLNVVNPRLGGAISRMNGIRCGYKETSCPDQLARALEKAQKAKKEGLDQ